MKWCASSKSGREVEMAYQYINIKYLVFSFIANIDNSVDSMYRSPKFFCEVRTTTPYLVHIKNGLFRRLFTTIPKHALLGNRFTIMFTTIGRR